MTDTDAGSLGRALREVAIPLTGAKEDYAALLASIGSARFVLIGEESHGTREFYRERARITRLLIEQKGFSAVAIEADWPDAYRVNRFVRGTGTDASAVDALAGFERFPIWMWRNTEVADFITWLRAHNELQGRGQSGQDRQVGLYGLDLYSLFTSIRAVLGYLEKVDPDAALRARARYACFDHFSEDTQAYGYAAALKLGPSCEQEVVNQLVELQRRAGTYAQRDGRAAEDEFFFAEQNARMIKNAEEYYRAMFRGRNASWNLRDTHMVDTLAALEAHLSRHRDAPKIVVWAHNSHLGDARATQLGEQGEINVGQLVRQRWKGESMLVGLTTYAGTVTAASEWDSPTERKRVNPALPGSYGDVLHHVGLPRFLLPLRDDERARDALRRNRLERAIGVIYRPDTERQSHYFHARLSAQFDAVLHFDQTSAVVPLDAPDAGMHDPEQEWETFPSGM